MENNNYQPQNNQPQYTQPQYNQPQYNQPPYSHPPYAYPQYGQPQYNQPYPAPETPDFLPKAIAAVVMSEFPIASIIAIAVGASNRRRIQEYLAMGGKRTPKVRVSSILSTVGLWLGVGMTIFYAIYFFIYFMAFFVGMHSSPYYY
jgi:hypothetical protein